MIRFKVELLQLVMVMEQAKAVRRLKERIKNFDLLYCKLESHPESSNLFYCCHVIDIDLYEDTLKKQMPAAPRITLKVITSVLMKISFYLRLKLYVCC